MQTLYSMETQDTVITSGDAIKLLQKQLDQTRQLFVYLTHFITEVARYAETDAKNRASKYIPSARDLQVNIKIAGNEILWKILEHPSYVQALKEDKPHLNNDPELTKKIYTELSQTEKYAGYVSKLSRDTREEKDILEYIFTDLMLPSDNFTSYIEERRGHGTHQTQAEKLGTRTHCHPRHAADAHGRMRIPVFRNHPAESHDQRIHRPRQGLQHPAKRAIYQWNTRQYPQGSCAGR